MKKKPVIIALVIFALSISLTGCYWGYRGGYHHPHYHYYHYYH